MSLYEDDDDVSGSDAELPSGDDDDGTLEDAAAAEEEHTDEGEQSGSSDGEEGQQGGSAQRKSSRGRKQQEREALVLPGGAAAEGAEQLMVPGNADTALLQLEVDALLGEVRIDYGRTAAVLEPFLSKLRKALAAIPEHQVQGTVAGGFLQALGVNPTEVTLAFQPPTAVTVVGSYALQTMAQPDTVVDVAVQIPDACLFKKAHLNYRYHARRALYLCALASHLASSPDPALSGARQELSSACHDPTRPALLLHLPASSSAARSGGGGAPSTPSLCVRLLPVPSPGLFPAYKLAPERNGVRWVTKPAPAPKAGANSAPAAAHGTATQPSAAAAVPLPTPQYNAAVLSDSACTCHTAYLSSVFSAAPGLTDGVVLLKAWARQRGLLGRPNGLDGHLLTMLVAHLLEQSKLAAGSTPLQVLRQALLALGDASTGLAKGLAMSYVPHASLAPLTAPCTSVKPPTLAQYRQHYAAALVDPTGWVNLAARVSSAAAAQTQAAARKSLSLLQAPVDADEAFTSALLVRGSPATTFDYTWRVALPQHEQQAFTSTVAAAASEGSGGARKQQAKGQAGGKGKACEGAEDDGGAECIGSSLVGDQVLSRKQEHEVESLIRRALGDRAKLVRALGRRLAPGQPLLAVLAAGLPALEAAGQLLVGAQLDAAQALRLVDVGPAADDATAAARFRGFWGERSELRRFQDGRICEAVVWHCGPGERHHVPDLAVTTAAARHLPAGTTITGCSGALDCAFESLSNASASTSLPSSSSPGQLPGSGGKHGKGKARGGALGSTHSTTAVVAAGAAAAARQVEAAAEKLGKQLRALEGMALKAIGFQPISAVTRQTCVFFPDPHPLAGGAAGAGDEVARCLEPVEVLVQLESSGKWPDDPTAFAKTKAALGLQLANALETAHGYKTIGSEECVDVLVDGYAFRLLFYSARDEAMLAKAQQPSQQPSQQAQRAAGAAAGPGPGSAATAAAAGAGAASRPPPLVRSWHHGLVSYIAGLNPAFAPTVRLAKRWLGCQLLSNQIGDEAAELLVAAVFAGSSALPSPGSRHSGFLRFLQLLSSFPFASRPLVVDPEHQLSAAERQQLLRSYARRKEAAGAAGVPALYIATPRDTESVYWTANQPSYTALQHAAAMAAKALRLLSSLTELGSLPTATNSNAPGSTAAPAMQPASELWMAAFVPPLDSFDVLLLLREEAVPQCRRALPALARLLAPSDATAATGAGRKRRRGGSGSAVGPAAGGVLSVWPVRGADCLTAGEEEAAGPPPKRCRVFLRAFPDKVAASRSPAQLLPELLVGFEPLPLLLDALAQRYGHLAEFGADLYGGCRAVGVKWRPEAFLPAPISVHAAHALQPCSLTSGGGGSKGPVLCVPNLLQVLAEMRELGEGLVEDLVAPVSCRRLV